MYMRPVFYHTGESTEYELQIPADIYPTMSSQNNSVGRAPVLGYEGH